MRCQLVLSRVEWPWVRLLSLIAVHLFRTISRGAPSIEWVRHPAKLHENSSVFFQNFPFDFLVLRVHTHVQFALLLLVLQHVAHIEGRNQVGQVAQRIVISDAESPSNNVFLFHGILVEHCEKVRLENYLLELRLGTS